MEAGVLRGRTGSGLHVVAGRSFVAAVGSPVSPTVLAALVDAAASGAAVRLERLMAALPTAGADAVGAFAVVIRESGRTDAFTVVARGDLVVELRGERLRRFTSGGIVPFHLAEFAAVDGFRIMRGADAGAHPGGEAADGGGPGHPPEGARPIGPGVAVDADLVDWAAERPLAPPAAAEAPASPAPRTARPVRYRIDDGPVRLLEGTVRIGRAPRRARIQREDTLVLTVPAAATVSGTHLELRREGTRIVADDLDSANGTTLIRGGLRTRIRPGEPRVIEAGTRLQLGDDTIVEILPNHEERPA
ncbi:FHA domain-containing protein [Agromyces archimandritae]|uniref:FHA domain-containing protein n=1 Tax=Agromyces archimandritae TaxID=2781962 RepID=A0A975FP95_9MICO|nr:FHA domain-containing protein [Agromyces archimandritae]QTX05143.1 FHA domain-containing protein [Agromyces archimandritae]